MLYELTMSNAAIEGGDMIGSRERLAVRALASDSSAI